MPDCGISGGATPGLGREFDQLMARLQVEMLAIVQHMERQHAEELSQLRDQSSRQQNEAPATAERPGTVSPDYFWRKPHPEESEAGSDQRSDLTSPCSSNFT